MAFGSIGWSEIDQATTSGQEAYIVAVIDIIGGMCDQDDRMTFVCQFA